MIIAEHSVKSIRKVDKYDRDYTVMIATRHRDKDQGLFLHVAITSLHHHPGLGHPTDCNLRSGVRQLAYPVWDAPRGGGWSRCTVFNASGVDTSPTVHTTDTKHQQKRLAHLGRACQHSVYSHPLQGQERLLVQYNSKLRAAIESLQTPNADSENFHTLAHCRNATSTHNASATCWLAASPI